MKNSFCFFIFFLLIGFYSSQAQYWKVTEMSPMPERVSNNAVASAVVNGVPYVYSFAGIDSTKSAAGIHLRSFRYNTLTDEWASIAPLPDTMGKIAAAASTVGNIIYIIGGYHVFSNGGEVSSNKVHRFNTLNNTYLSDGAPIPTPIDDQVQAVWRDSLIYVVTGWSDTGNVPNVQIYDTANDTWMSGSFVPDNDLYRAFGAAGVIIEDSIFYYGGAAGPGFGITGILRKGIINPNMPAQIGWLALNGDPDHQGYRMAATSVEGNPYWLGGSANTYNFDGDAYDGSGGVPPANRSIFYKLSTKNWQVDLNNPLPMDLRGVGEISDTVKYLAGGMLADQWVSDKTYRLERSRTPVMTSTENPVASSPVFRVYPNPSPGAVHLEALPGKNLGTVEVWNAKGSLILRLDLKGKDHYLLDLGTQSKGIYWLKSGTGVRKVVID